MTCRTILSEVKVEAVVFLVKTHLFDLAEKFLIIVFTLAAADDLADARNETVHSSNSLAILVELHVECFDLLRVIGNEYRTFEDLLCQITLVLSLKVAAPEYFVIECVIVLFKKLDRLCVSNMTEFGI